jgi:aarF domain-containing kinase
MQRLIVEEMVAAINALTREALCEAFKVVFASNAAVTALRNAEALGPLRALLLPIPTPLAFLSDVGHRVTLTAEDRAALDTLSLLLDMLGGRARSSSSSHSRGAGAADAPDVLQLLAELQATSCP